MIQERFEAKFIPEPNSGCWLWTAASVPRGYGKFRVDDKAHYAHRVSYKLYVGEVGDNCVLHKCDNPACVNPDHLFLGTIADNAADMVKKGRSARGEKQYQSKFTAEQVRAIRADDRPQRVIAAEYGVHQPTIQKIKARTNWGHVL